MLRNELRLKCSRFIRKIRHHVLALHKGLELEIPKKIFDTKKVSKRLNGVREKEEEETWGKKRKRSHNYFKGAFTAKVLSTQQNIQHIPIPKIIPSNGLINDNKYYETKTTNSRLYVVSNIQARSNMFDKLTSESYRTLSQPQNNISNNTDLWLDNSQSFYVSKFC